MKPRPSIPTAYRNGPRNPEPGPPSEARRTAVMLPQRNVNSKPVTPVVGEVGGVAGVAGSGAGLAATDFASLEPNRAGSQLPQDVRVSFFFGCKDSLRE